MQNRSHKAVDLFIITLIACVLYLPFLGGTALFDWDEINFAECAREMLVSGNFKEVQLNFQPFWEKPPLFIWFQVGSMKLFGITEFAARFPNAICGIVTLISLYLIGSRHYSRKMGWSWVLFYIGSLLPHFYFRTGIIDPWFNYFIFLGLYFFFLASKRGGFWLYFILSGLLSGLAVLTKGPAAIVIIALTVLFYLIWAKQLKSILRTPAFLIFVFTTIVVSSSWFLVVWLRGEAEVISSFITYQIRLAQTKDAGHGGPFFYHFIILLLGCFPASLFFIYGYRGDSEEKEELQHLRKFILCLFWSVLIIFSLVETKIVHYSSLCYLPLTFIAALSFENLPQLNFQKKQKFIFWLISCILLLATLLVGFSRQVIESVLSADLIKNKELISILKTKAHSTGFELMLPFLFLAGVLFLYKGLLAKKRQTVQNGLVATTLFIAGAIYWVTPLIATYSQDAAIAFYKAAAKQDCYLETYKFKSYAYLFYGQRQPYHYQNTEQQRAIAKQLDLMEKEGHSRLESYATANAIWMVYGEIDKPAYLVSKIGHEDELLKLGDIHKLYDQNGFSFFVRLPKIKPVK